MGLHSALPTGGDPAPGSDPRHARIAALKQRIDGLSTGSELAQPVTLPASRPQSTPAAEPSVVETALAGQLPLDPALREAFGPAALRTGTTTTLHGAWALAVATIAAASARGTVGLIGAPFLCLADVPHWGGRLDTIVWIPAPQTHAAEVASLLVGAVDLMIIDESPQSQALLSPTQRRVLQAKLRGSTTALLSLGGEQTGTQAHIVSRITDVAGLDLAGGRGRVQRLVIAVEAAARGRLPHTSTVVLGGEGITLATPETPSAAAPVLTLRVG